MTKIDGKYEQFWTENLLKQINSENSITKLHHLITRYLYQRGQQIEKILANMEDDDIDLAMVIEQLWEDLELARKQLLNTTDRSDFYAEYYKLDEQDIRIVWIWLGLCQLANDATGLNIFWIIIFYKNN